MKETKKFFANNNRLNKGYVKFANPRESDSNFYRKKFEHTLPPIDLMAEYENIHPGTLAKLIDMAEKEQIHRHTMDTKSLEVYKKITTVSKICALIFVIFACIATLSLTLFGYFISAGIFTSVVLLSIFIGSIMSANKFTKKRDYEQRRDTSP